ncbi:DUF1364 family protein [Oxalobacter formigenes]|uniref:DUF1364 family protein n=1 Tax=Oxalobacter formigenes TaxID=847 RepID=UPI00055D3C7E|nr:DUF1364 family protein [Oxalobacter formigenes]ARQ46699.1 hypothetical protein BRW83_1960 [Oxalobacter formigenes]ARQ78768.1 hypothetical protein BRW84_09215 [Oxalobacter formigenes OXCC13]MCZ4062631.1 DUF1364 family protein [Oxalobacter formigenes]QDX32655.1 DUF1364 family protein [Oxalobacter formigenes]
MMYRNKKLLDLARHSPMCFCCGKVNDGTVVAAHSNQLRDGKGKGIKAYDFRVAYLCNGCHSEIDQGSKLNKQERIERWEEAHRKTVEWWFLSGVLEVGRGTK